MVWTSPRRASWVPVGTFSFCFAIILRIAPATPPRSRWSTSAVDVVDGLDVVVVDDDRGDVALEVGDIAEELADVAGGRSNGYARKRLETVDAVLRGLNDHLVVDGRFQG